MESMHRSHKSLVSVQKSSHNAHLPDSGSPASSLGFRTPKIVSSFIWIGTEPTRPQPSPTPTDAKPQRSLPAATLASSHESSMDACAVRVSTHIRRLRSPGDDLHLRILLILLCSPAHDRCPCKRRAESDAAVAHHERGAQLLPPRGHAGSARVVSGCVE